MNHTLSWRNQNRVSDIKIAMTFIRTFAAPEGIRTLDPNLGKWRGIRAPCSPKRRGLPASRAAQSGGWPIFSAIDAPIGRESDGPGRNHFRDAYRRRRCIV